MGPRPLVLLSFPRARSQPLPPCLMYELAESPWHQDRVRRQGQARQDAKGRQDKAALEGQQPASGKQRLPSAEKPSGGE